MVIVGILVIAGFAMLYFVVKNVSKPESTPGGAAGQQQGEQQAEKQKEKPKVKVYRVSKENFTHIMETLGTIIAKSEVTLRFEVNGVVDAINVQEGDQVRQGDVVGELVHGDAELKVDFRRSKLKEAQIEEKNWRVKVQQNKELLEAGAINEAKFNESKFAHQRAKQAVKSAKIELRSAESELEKTYLRTPIDGIVGEVKAHKGEFVSTQTKVLTIMEISEVYCEFSVLEKDIQDVREEQTIYLMVDTYPGEKFQGAISSMGSIVNTVEGRSRKVKALVSNEDSKLIPGMFAHVEVILLQRDNALCVPVSAFPDIERDTSTVWVIQGEDKVTQRQITVEHFNLEKALVDTGLQPGDLVVVDITSVKLEDGMQVEIVEVREPPKEEG
jgi:membrane fusion protein (multidrug efflux system)